MNAWTVAFAMYLCGATAAEPLVISPGSLPLATTGGVLGMNALPGPGFFGTLNGMPAEPTYFTELQLAGKPGAPLSGAISNLAFDSLAFLRDKASANASVSFTDTRSNPGNADAILVTSGGSIPDIGLGGLGVTEFSFTVPAFSVHSTSPLSVTYGTGPSAVTAPFAVAIDLDPSRGTGSASVPLEWTGDSSGIVFDASHPVLFLPATITFTNPSIGDLRMSTTLQAGSSGEGEWHIEAVPESGTVAFIGLGLITFSLLGRRVMRT